VLVGDSTKARELLGWRPKYTFEKLVKEMVQEDIEALGPFIRGKSEITQPA